MVLEQWVCVKWRKPSVKGLYRTVTPLPMRNIQAVMVTGEDFSSFYSLLVFQNDTTDMYFMFTEKI